MLIIGASLLSFALVAADATPSFACSEARTIVEKTICQELNLAEADRDLAAVFAKLRDSFDSKRRQSLIAGQRAWLKLRAKACVPSDETSDGEIKVSDCLRAVYAQRANELQREAELQSVTSDPKYHGHDVNMEELLDQKRNLAHYYPTEMSQLVYAGDYPRPGYLPKTCRELYTLTSGNWRYGGDTIGLNSEGTASSTCGLAVLSAANYAARTASEWRSRFDDPESYSVEFTCLVPEESGCLGAPEHTTSYRAALARAHRKIEHSATPYWPPEDMSKAKPMVVSGRYYYVDGFNFGIGQVAVGDFTGMGRKEALIILGYHDSHATLSGTKLVLGYYDNECNCVRPTELDARNIWKDWPLKLPTRP
ncbi:MAG TPA: lysozyme inhibitor LprI family protein [Stellaceae bacterium]|nr:lysozyme inhibitor LprI family protein [Stellaceae bacterium]